MKIKQHHISIASLVSAVLCPLPFIFLLDEFSRESEFGPQFLGFALASAGTFAYCAILLPILLFFSLVLKRDERLLVDDKWAKRLFIFGLTVCIVYIAIGLVCFQGMYLDNTAFYLASRFAPYFISIVFCLLASIFSISKNSRKISVKQIIPCFPPLLILAEKIFVGRITHIDILFAVAYLVIYAMFAGIQKESDRHPDAF